MSETREGLIEDLTGSLHATTTDVAPCDCEECSILQRAITQLRADGERIAALEKALTQLLRWSKAQGRLLVAYRVGGRTPEKVLDELDATVRAEEAATSLLTPSPAGAGVPVWVKQDSAKLPGQRGIIPDDLWIQERPLAAVRGNA